MQLLFTKNTFVRQNLLTTKRYDKYSCLKFLFSTLRFLPHGAWNVYGQCGFDNGQLPGQLLWVIHQAGIIKPLAYIQTT